MVQELKHLLAKYCSIILPNFFRIVYPGLRANFGTTYTFLFLAHFHVFCMHFYARARICVYIPAFHVFPYFWYKMCVFVCISMFLIGFYMNLTNLQVFVHIWWEFHEFSSFSRIWPFLGVFGTFLRQFD